MITSKQLTNLYFNFFESKGHKIIPSASLIPENDPSVLFNTAGMQPLVPYLLGETHPMGKRLADIQKCLRTVDFDNIGDNTHNTFFQMLGNWSLGDYFKEDSIKWGFEFLTSKEWLGLDINKLGFTVYEGKDPVPKDEEAFNLWKNLGISEKRIAYWGEDNFWSAGPTGPCGPSSEIFYWTGEGQAPEIYDPNNEDWVEIWNHVFMTYNKTADGKLEELKKKNIDTGMGFERTLSAINNKKSAFETDLFSEVIKKIEEISGHEYIENNEITKSMRIIADHIRAAVMVMGDEKGIGPSNMDQGYIVRRLIRRSIRHGRLLDIHENFCESLAKIIIKNYQDTYPELKERQDFILNETAKEENKFANTVEKGLKEFDKLLNGFRIAFEKTGKNNTEISGKQAFKLYDTYGFPLEMTQELANEKGLTVDVNSFDEAFLKHQSLSREGAQEKFKGGLADDGIETTRLHTATHLLHKALKQVLGDHVEQRGSNITSKRLRFDFSHGDKLTDEEKKQVEDLVNQAILAKYPVTCEEMSLEQAKKQNAIGLFGDKYGEVVKVYTIGGNPSAQGGPPFSREICGGPHVKNTGELGTFRIKKEESSSSGIRRIKAILE